MWSVYYFDFAPGTYLFLMKNSIKIHKLLRVAFVVILFFSFNACTEEQAMPVSDKTYQELQIKMRTDGPVSIQLIKQKVSNRDHIPIGQILDCYYYGQTSQGYWEYHISTINDGPKIYIVTQIIGEDCEGL